MADPIPTSSRTAAGQARGVAVTNGITFGDATCERLWSWGYDAPSQIPMASAKSQRQMGIADRAMPFRHRAVAEEFTVTSRSPTVRRRELGARLRALRTERGLTVDDVATRIEVSPAKISRIETTVVRGVSLSE